MKNYLLLIFSILILRVNAQVEDNFHDGDFTNAPSWSGSTGSFIINNDLQLRLNAASAGNSFLSVPVNLSSLDSCEWHFFIHLDVSPSSSNHSRVYLTSDQPDLLQPLNGYFLQFGESLSNDAIELFRQNGTSLTSVCRASDGLIANPFSAGIKVLRDASGVWSLFVDYNGGKNYNLEANDTDFTFSTAGWMGVCCLYTGGNVSKFYFDDFYAGHEIPDTISPFVVSLDAESDTIISIIFSEKIENSTLINLNNYNVDNSIGHPSMIFPDSLNSLKYFLRFTTPFLTYTNYTITFQGIKDPAQNPLTIQNLSFIYYPLVNPEQLDVVFSEIYFEPSAMSPLPEAEYVEVYNRKDSSIDISGWTITDGNSTAVIPGYRISPHSSVVLISENDSDKFASVVNAVSLNDFPTLNNDVGDHLILYDQNGQKIDEIDFNDGYYHDDNKNDGGWSIERINTEFTCQNENNWKASVSFFHGTPGTLNSVAGNFSDTKSPYVKNTFLNDSNSLTIIFSEPVIEGAEEMNNYEVRDNAGNLLNISSATAISDDTVVLVTSINFSSGIYNVKVSASVKDCPGNMLESLRTMKVGFPEVAERMDVVINEILFNCYDEGNDFVELYNNSSKIIDLYDWKIAETDYNDSLDVKDIAAITSGRQLFFPGEYLVLSEEEKKVSDYYSCLNLYSFIDVTSMPDYNSDEGRVEVFDKNGNTIDAIRFNEDMHFPLIAEVKGISLERLNASEKSNGSFNWHSAAATAGFATPGYGNSQWMGKDSCEGEVSVGMEIFSPDNDGYEDVLAINYKFPQAGTVLSLNVFDVNGIPVRTILSGETVANEGMLTWDGLTDAHLVAPSGIYILFARSFDLEGNDHVFKKPCYLTRRF